MRILDNLHVPQVRGFKMVSLNIGSLPHHVEKLRTWLLEQNIDLTETCLDRDVTDNRNALRAWSAIFGCP
jgi:hypothetical protein